MLEGQNVSIRCCIAFLLVASMSSSIALGLDEDVRFEHFEKKVRPLLAEHCWSCHGADQQRAGLRLDSGEAVLRGSQVGPVVIPRRSDQSRLIEVIRRAGEIKMPPDEGLTGCQETIRSHLPYLIRLTPYQESI